MAATARTIGERGIIRRAEQRLRADRSVAVGIGDDAAALRFRPGPGELLLFASDMLVEGVHFRLRGRGAVAPRAVGWKALAVNISDIAAMGGAPRWAVVSVGVPPATPVRVTDGIADGLARCASRFTMSVVGGDTVRAPRLVIDVAIIGTVQAGRLLRRSGARVGDAVFVTGRLGGSYPSGRHAAFLPRVAEAQALARRLRIRIPVARSARSVYHALMDGEDFELLFTVGGGDAGRVPPRIGACPVTRIGTVTRRGAGVELVDGNGRVRPLVPKGFRHF
jgi:thiamin-phosphate kinase